MATTRQGLIDFKKEVEQELINAKQVWLNSFTDEFLIASPYDTGFFINQTDIKIGSRSNSFGINKKQQTKRSSKFNKIISKRGVRTTSRIEFKINKPYDNIKISNYVFYNKEIEFSGWTHIGPYAPFKKSNRISHEKLNLFLKNL